MSKAFTAAMRGLVLHDGKPISDFLGMMMRHERRVARYSEGPDIIGFRAQHGAARHKLCRQDSAPKPIESWQQAAPLICNTAPKLVTWLQAGVLICDAAHRLLATTPNIDPETALRQTVHAVNKGELSLQRAHNGSLRLG